MKKILFSLLLPFLLYNCSAFYDIETKEWEHSSIVIQYDFTKYSSQGFLITTETYLKDYESIGLFSATIYPSVKKMVGTSKSLSDKYYIEATSTGTWIVEKININDVIDEMYNRSINLGANAIMNFRSNLVYQYDGSIRIPTYEVSGFAIKRKNN